MNYSIKINPMTSCLLFSFKAAEKVVSGLRLFWKHHFPFQVLDQLSGPGAADKTRFGQPSIWVVRVDKHRVSLGCVKTGSKSTFSPLKQLENRLCPTLIIYDRVRKEYFWREGVSSSAFYLGRAQLSVSCSSYQRHSILKSPFYWIHRKTDKRLLEWNRDKIAWLWPKT